jgi:hypothetical protein
MPPVLPQNLLNHLPVTSQNIAGSVDSYNIHDTFPYSNSSDVVNSAGAYLGGAGTFLGIAQQSSDNPIPNEEIMHLFNGEDMGLWLGETAGYGGNISFQ